MTEQTPAELAAEEIGKRFNNGKPLAPHTLKWMAEIITCHLGDGRDKKRMDWLQRWANKFIVTFATYSNGKLDLSLKDPQMGSKVIHPIHNAANLRAAVDERSNLPT